VKADGTATPDTIIFFQDTPFNNLWLMVILIWIQTGFAMVILSSAIKAVPTELTEAARIDGASQTQIFWRVTVPQIGPTIGVVVTTLIVTVMKVFDIVKVSTNGQSDTEVIANQMFTSAFGNSNEGLGAALAVVLFISIIPVMYVNIRRIQQNRA
jgi:alpha-glucoside transport system permease protein